MRKFTIFLLSFLFIFSLTACEKTVSYEVNIPGQEKEEGYQLDKIYKDDNFPYTVYLPANWQIEKPQDNIRLFAGPENQETYYTTINIQYIPLGENSYQNLDEAVNDLIQQLKTAENAEISEVKEYIRDSKDHKLSFKGKIFEASYTLNGENFKQWQIVLPDSENKNLYLWAYTAPSNLYDKYKDLAHVILMKWDIEK